MTGDLRELPITFSQARARMVVIVVLGLAMLVFGMTIQPNHWTLDGLIPAEWFLIPTGLVTIGVGLIGFVRPARLTLSPAGIEYHHLLSTRRMPWSAIRNA
jgi:hypothetical protein